MAAASSIGEALCNAEVLRRRHQEKAVVNQPWPLGWHLEMVDGGKTRHRDIEEASAEANFCADPYRHHQSSPAAARGLACDLASRRACWRGIELYERRGIK